MGDWRSLIDFKGRCLRDIGNDLRIQFIYIVCKDRGLVAGARDGDVPETGIEQIRVNAGVGIDQNAFRGETLGTVAGNSVAVVEMAMLFGIEFDLPVIVEAGRDAAIRRYGFDGGKVAVGDAKRLVRSGELDTVADGKLPRRLPDTR